MLYTIIAKEDPVTGEWIASIPAFPDLTENRYGSIAEAVETLEHTISVRVKEAATGGSPRPVNPTVEIFKVEVFNPYWVEAPDDREQTAYHEAGHAVAMLLNRYRFQHVTITPTDDYQGAVTRLPYSEKIAEMIECDQYSTRARRWIEDRIIEGYAGATAVLRKWDDTYPEEDGTGQDHADIADWALSMSASDDEATAYLAWLRQRAINLWNAEHRWCQVEALATALLERNDLRYREARQIARDAEQRVFDQRVGKLPAAQRSLRSPIGA